MYCAVGRSVVDMCGSACGSGVVWGTQCVYCTVGSGGMRYHMSSSSGVTQCSSITVRWYNGCNLW